MPRLGRHSLDSETGACGLAGASKVGGEAVGSMLEGM